MTQCDNTVLTELDNTTFWQDIMTFD